jgi:hypothetical protein
MSRTILCGATIEDGSKKANNGAARAGVVRVRSVALPVEHGGWGFTLEPIILGLLVAPSLSGLFLAITTMAAFLARHPLKLAMADHRRGRRLARTPIAERFVLLYSMLATLGLLAAIMTASSYDFLLPLVLAAPLALIQILYDRVNRSRALLPELAGSTAMAAIASSIALSADWPRPLAFALWAILAARIIPTIIYVRARLKILHGQQASTLTVLIMHILALAVALALLWAKLASALAVVALLILLIRALLGFLRRDQTVNAKQIGIRELGFGAITVIAVALGHYFRL